MSGYDGSSASERALRLSAPILAPKRALVVTVWEPDVECEALAPGVAPVPIDIRAALLVDETLYEGAQRLAEHGAAQARQLGLDAEGMAVADVLTVASTLVRLARERDAPATVVGCHGRNPLRELLVGGTAREVIRHAPGPVTVVTQRRVHEQEEEGEDEGAA